MILPSLSLSTRVGIGWRTTLTLFQEKGEGPLSSNWCLIFAPLWWDFCHAFVKGVTVTGVTTRGRDLPQVPLSTCLREPVVSDSFLPFPLCPGDCHCVQRDRILFQVNFVHLSDHHAAEVYAEQATDRPSVRTPSPRLEKYSLDLTVGRLAPWRGVPRPKGRDVIQGPPVPPRRGGRETDTHRRVLPQWDKRTFRDFSIPEVSLYRMLRVCERCWESVPHKTLVGDNDCYANTRLKKPDSCDRWRFYESTFISLGIVAKRRSRNLGGPLYAQVGVSFFPPRGKICWSQLPLTKELGFSLILDHLNRVEFV